MVTAEFAVALPSLLLVVATALSLVSASATRLRCLAAAEESARLAARGQNTAGITAYLRADAPAGSSVTLSPAGAGLIAATVRDVVRLPVLGVGTPLSVSARVVDPLEPGVGPP